MQSINFENQNYSQFLIWSASAAYHWSHSWIPITWASTAVREQILVLLLRISLIMAQRSLHGLSQNFILGSLSRHEPIILWGDIYLESQRVREWILWRPCRIIIHHLRGLIPQGCILSIRVIFLRSSHKIHRRRMSSANVRIRRGSCWQVWIVSLLSMKWRLFAFKRIGLLGRLSLLFVKLLLLIISFGM